MSVTAAHVGRSMLLRRNFIQRTNIRFTRTVCMNAKQLNRVSFVPSSITTIPVNGTTNGFWHPKNIKLPVIRLLSTRRFSPYDVLGVSTSASDKEIKMAYLEMARKYHPDVNTDDDEAKQKFQDAAKAFEILSDKSKRSEFDNNSSSDSWYNQGTQYNDDDMTQAEKQFMAVLEELDTMRSVMNKYIEELKEDAEGTKEAVQRGELQEILSFASKHKVLAGAIVAPLMLIFRMPWMVPLIIRVSSQVVVLLLRAYEQLPPSSKAALVYWVRELFINRKPPRDFDGSGSGSSSGSNRNSEEAKQRPRRGRSSPAPPRR
eukprot:m.66436 g.66436  ORF g.66436 m.66436 type:complete len:317 (+) comp11806_c0_seq1:193-1143(+)